MPDLLLEIFCEEIPARMQRKAAGDLKKQVTDKLVNAGLTYEAARAYWTPRRLTLDLRGLNAKSCDIREERKGPPVNAPESAITGFMRSAGIDCLSQAEIASDPKKGNYYIVKTIRCGRKAEAIIAEVMPDIIRNFSWPKSMRWGDNSAHPGSLRWVRPLVSILCLLSNDTDSEVVNFEVSGIRSGNVTYGHHFMSGKQPIAVRRFADYTTKLEQAKVILDADRRKEIILSDARNLCFAIGLDLVEDDELAEEVACLVEWPVVLTGHFNKEFLVIPPEIIRLTIRTNQKSFVTRIRGEKNVLSNRFILVANIETEDGGKGIAKGNGKVIRARLSDALYFWRTDQENLPDINKLATSCRKFCLDLKKPLDQRMARLDQLDVTFHTKLGTQGERVFRIAALAMKIASLVDANPKLVHRAATLAKADLQTEVVGEFPELQGLIGRKYASLQGENSNVSLAIEEHYKPQGQSDNVPHNPVSIAVALADKIDTLVGFWLIDEKPTGSRDPYALRRAAIGVIRLVLSQKQEIHLVPLFNEAVHLLESHIPEPCLSASENTEKNNALDADIISSKASSLSCTSSILQDLLVFFHDRLKVYLRDEGMRHDAIDAVLIPQSDNFLQATRKVEALIAFLDTDDGKKLLGSIKRVLNILDAETRKKTPVATTVDPSLFLEQDEVVLYRAIADIAEKITILIKEGNFTEALHCLSTLTGPIDDFFEKILVNDKNPVIRANRLAILTCIHTIISQVADFSKITG